MRKIVLDKMRQVEPLCSQMLKRHLALFAALAAICSGQVPAGFVQTSFFGTPIVMPLLATYMANWQQTVENQSILSLVNQGDASPVALAAEAVAVANGFCAATSNAPVPDCASATATSAVVTPITQAITAAASTVPASQWVVSSWQPSVCSTIALCVAVQAATPPPPAPVTGPLVVLPCATVGAVTMCYAGAGVVNVTASGFSYLGTQYANGAVIEYSSTKYQAHISSGLMGPSIWFSPVATTGLYLDGEDCTQTGRRVTCVGHKTAWNLPAGVSIRKAAAGAMAQ